MMAKEKNLDNDVMEFIESIGGWYIKYWAGAAYTKKGIPDILACINGQFYGIEDKSEDGKPTLLQLRNLRLIRSAGGFGILLYPDQFENFKQFAIEKTYLGIKCCSKKTSIWYEKNILLQKEWKEKLEK